MDDLKKMIGQNEKILYEGKPDKKCYIFESIFNPLLPFAIIWAIIDFSVMGFAMFTDESNFIYIIIPFMLLHMMPVWIYLAGILFTMRRYKNTNYIVTDMGVYISQGMFAKSYQTKPFTELSHVDLHRVIFDQKFNVGDIIITTNQFNQNNVAAALKFDSISNYTEVYNIIKKLQKDIYTDVMYPNDLRPKENHGYNTEYKG